MSEYCYNVNDVNFENNLKDSLNKVFGGKKFIICCIGTDAVIGDCLGPMIGSRLKENIGGKSYIFGSVEAPIIAKDIKSLSEVLSLCFVNTPILAIDAAFGVAGELGCVKFCETPLKPGLGVNKDLPLIGTHSLIGILAKKGDDFLNSVRFSSVLPFVDKICRAIEGYFFENSDLSINNTDFSDFSLNFDNLPFNLLKNAN